MNGPIKSKLSIMMFLEFFIWGCWFVTMGTFLSQAFSASGSQISLAYSTQSWGAIISPFIIGLIADRYFDAEKVGKMVMESFEKEEFDVCTIFYNLFKKIFLTPV